MKVIQSQYFGERGSSLPLEIYDSVVRSLHGDLRALLVGKIATWIAVALVCYRGPSDALMAIAGLLVVVGTFRLYSVHRFHQRAKSELSLDQLRSAEKSYNFWAASYVLLLGIFCFATTAVTSDDLVHLIAISMTLAYIIGIAGRNFASAKVVNSQVLAVSIPLVGGLFLFGETYHSLLALLLLPFLLAKLSIADRLRKMLFSAVLMAIDKKTIADRFEAALKNASHGMAMVNRDGGFVVANERFNDLAGLPLEFNTVGANFSQLTAEELFHRKGGMPGETLSEKLRLCLVEGKRRRFQYRRTSGEMIEASFNPMSEGAGVIVLEDISDRIKSETEIRKLANYDPLTHLPNRRHFTELVKSRFHEGSQASAYTIYFADLDNFKQINDSLGHPVGDKLICAVSLRMKSCLPEHGMICRFGGDEFVVIVPGSASSAECERFSNRLIQEVSKPILIDGHLIIVGASVGIASSPTNATEFDQLLKMADVALYEAKTRGRGTFNFYSDELGEKIRERRQMEVDLRRAVQRRELTVHYQPVVDLKENRISACEALVRWTHPLKGPVSPAEFIPMAEEIGIISKIGKFVLEEATREARSWPGHMRVAVNVSSLQFQQSDIVQVISDALASSGLPASRLEVEVTESAAVEDLDETSRVLRTLAQNGVRISLDDFGTGFSSLSYLHQLPLDKVKIDRSFIESIKEDSRSLILLTGVTRMAADLGLTVIVEGIEREEQLAILQDKVHVDQVQGYLFGRPMPAEDIRRLVLKDVDALQADSRMAARPA